MTLKSHFVKYLIPFVNQTVNILTQSLTLTTNLEKHVTDIFLKFSHDIPLKRITELLM